MQSLMSMWVKYLVFSLKSCYLNRILSSVRQFQNFLCLQISLFKWTKTEALFVLKQQLEAEIRRTKEKNKYEACESRRERAEEKETDTKLELVLLYSKTSIS